MTYELSEDHEQFRRTVRDFAEKEIAPHAAQWDREHHFPVDVVHKMGQLGLFGLNAPEQYGGADGDFTSLCVAIEELGRVDQSMGITLEAAVGLGINPILTFGTDEQKDTWLPDLVEGRKLAGFGLTEPGAGSDAGATKTKAELRDGEWVINGSKQFITNSGSEITSLVTVTARTGTVTSGGGGEGKAEVSTIIVPSDTEGFTAEKAYDKLGWHASDTHPLSFTDARVPESNLLGERGRGFAQFLAILDDGRVAIAALAVGCIQACLDVSLAVRRGADHVRRTHRSQAGGGVPDRRPGGDARREPAAHLPGRLDEGRREADEGVQAGGGHRQALRHRVGGHRDQDRHPGLRRLRLHGGVPRRTVLPGRQGPRDRRGHLGGPADADRPRPRPPGGVSRG